MDGGDLPPLAEPIPAGSTGTLTSPATDLLGAHLTQAGGVIGTPGYMAPEQIRGEGLDARADAFAFCASVYHGLYGQKAFAATAIFRTPEEGEAWLDWMRDQV